MRSQDQDLRNLRVLDAISHEVALDAMENGKLTPELRADVQAIEVELRRRLTELRRHELARAPTARLATIRPSILAMPRDALLARLAELRALHPGAVFAHRDFAVLTDADLRSAIEDAETAREHAG